MEIYFKSEFKYRDVKKEARDENPAGVIIAAGEHEGFHFFVKDMNGRHPTAYVVVTKGHPLYGWEGSSPDAENRIDVHGGVTYSENHLVGIDIGKDKWVIGWDYAHCNDFAGYYTEKDGEYINSLKKWTIDEILWECQYACNQLKVIQNENEGNENNDEDEAGFIARLKIPFKFMGKELKFGEYNTKECGSYYYENILGGVLHIIARRNFFKCINGVVIMYSNEENLKRSNVRVCVEEEKFCEEGLKHIFGRMIRDFAMSAVEANKEIEANKENKGEEK